MRRALLILGLLALGLVLLLATAPFWLPWAVRPVAGRYGATFTAYERIGYDRFVLRDVRVRRQNVQVWVEQVEADTPVLWAWRHLGNTPSEIKATRWSVDVARREGTPGTPAPRRSGWRRLQGILTRVAGGLDRWLREARVGPGVVRWPTGEVSIDTAAWRAAEAGGPPGVQGADGPREARPHSGLLVQGLRFRSLLADASLHFRPDGEMELAATSYAADARLALATKGAEVSGRVTWASQDATLKAEFPSDGWQPRLATLNVPALQLPAERARLPGYGDVTGQAQATWNGEALDLKVDVAAAPLPGRDLPALALKLAADAARRDRARLTQLDLRIPGGEARLSGPVLIDRQGQVQGEPAELRFRFDLASQPWVPARGIVTGRVVARSGSPGSAVPALPVTFAVEGSDLRLGDMVLRDIRAAGDFHWPRLRVQDAGVVGPQGEKLTGRFEVDLAARTFSDASLSGGLSGRTLARWLPSQLAFDQAHVDLRAQGPFAAPRHEGTVVLRHFVFARVPVDRVDASWRGEGRGIAEATVALSAGDAMIKAQGQTQGASALRLNQLHWTKAGQPVLALKAPATISFAPVFAVDALHLEGPDAAVEGRVTWGPAGRLDVTVRGLQSAALRPFLALPGPSWKIDSWALTGSWAEGPMTFSSAGELTAELPEQRTATVRASIRGDTQGVSIEALHALESSNAVVNASGRLPMVVTPWVASVPDVAEPAVPVKTGAKRGTFASRWFELNPDGPLAFEAVTVPNAAFWRQIGAMTGVELEAPQLTARLEGSWREPSGRIEFRLVRAAMNPERFPRPLPTVENVDLALAGTGAGLELNALTFTVERQAVKAHGRLGMNPDRWPLFWQQPLAVWREHGQFRLQVPDAQVAMFSRFLPAALAPAGKVEADLSFESGQLTGFVRLREAASRPLGPLGVLQQVNADVEFRGRRIMLERVAATSGGQPVTLTGEVELPAGGWISGPERQPRYNVVLRGANVPFVRQAGLLIRGDLDLALRSNSEGAAAITGRVELRDSLFLTDIRSYLPRGGGASPARRPPYFSVDTPPLHQWALDVTVTGSRFLRMRMPVFSGVASTRFHLGGTLGEPRAIGDATIDEGAVLMPFTSFEVQQGAVRLTEESPYEPTIFLRGTGRHYGYDLTMEISGKASAPNITFSSSPALDPDQVLVMVTTGAAPSNEVTTSLTRRAVQIGAFVGQSLLGSLTGGEVEPGKLSVESGERISRQGRETYSIEYKLNGRWSVTGEYDEFDEYNAGFKWRVAPKGGRK